MINSLCSTNSFWTHEQTFCRPVTGSFAWYFRCLSRWLQRCLKNVTFGKVVNYYARTKKQYMNLVAQADTYGHFVTAKISDFLCEFHLLLLRCRRHLTKSSLLHNLTITVISCRRTGVKKACVVCSTSYLHMMHSFITNESVGIETWKYIHCIFHVHGSVHH
jgi:hypothetical protein